MKGSSVGVVLGVALAALFIPASTAALETTRPSWKHPKLDSSLARLAEGEVAGQTVEIEALARGGRGAELEAAVRAAGGVVSGRYRGLVGARVPLRALERLAAEPSVRSVRKPVRPIPQVVAGQGIAASGASAWHTAGTTGAGVKIAVVDVGFKDWQLRRTEGELPASVVTADFCGPGLFDGAGADDHGTAVAEVVHEIAPGAELHLVCIDDEISLGQAKDYAAENDIAIVNHSVGWLNVSRGDGSGGPETPDGIVADARAQGILWVNAAGNYGQAHWNGSFSDPDGDDLHNFNGADEGNEAFLLEGGCVFLKWDDWPSSDQDFDVYLFRASSDELVDFSEKTQSGTQEPTEVVCADEDDDYYFEIERFDATETPRFDVIVDAGDGLEHRVPGGSLIEPANSPHALAAGAVCVHSNDLEDYSSRGPTIDGRIKPDVSGQDGNSTATYGSSSDCNAGFLGTSAATPHVAGAAALLKQANPSLGPAELQTALEARANDFGPVGKDNDSGAGRLALGSPPAAPANGPINLAAPAISGFFHQGQTLTASEGDWSGGGVFFFSYRWLRCGASGASCVAITGARSSTYTPTAVDLGNRLRVRVTATNTGGAAQRTSEATAAIQPPMQAPANVIPPSLAGVAQFAQVVSASSGAWSGTAPLTITIEWLRCGPDGDACVVIAGAESATRQLDADDIGFTLRVRVTATNPAGSSTVESAPTPVVLPPLPGLLSSPTIAGNAVQGVTLTATLGAWSFATTLSIQWRRCTADLAACIDIAGATGTSYAVTAADAGSRLQVAVVASNSAGASSGVSPHTAVVPALLGITISVPPPPEVGPETENRPQSRLVVLRFTRSPQTPQAGRRFTLLLRVATRLTSAHGATRRVTCSAKVGSQSLRPVAKSIRGGVARCVWAVPRNAAGKRLRSAILVSEGARSVRKSVTAKIHRARPA